VGVAKQIHDIFENNGFETEVLAASFKNSAQVLALCEYGIGSATVAPDVIEGFVKNPAIDAAINVFISDFEGLVGEGKTMLNC
jgi:transaldolase